MFNILSDSIARAGGIESENDWRVREALRKAHKTDAVVLSTDNPKTREKSVAERVVGRWLLFKPTYNRVLI